MGEHGSVTIPVFRLCRVLLLGIRHGPALSSCKSMGRHCADNNAGAQRYPFSDRFQITGDRGTQLLRAIRLREDHSLITRGWSPVGSHPVYVRGGQVSDWEESQVLAALAVSELSAALQ